VDIFSFASHVPTERKREEKPEKTNVSPRRGDAPRRSDSRPSQKKTGGNVAIGQ
jgi:hypothetical protein